MRPYHVAIVGSGPSGYFAAASLLKFADTTDDADVRVDMLEMLPTPWGLVRSGVAPDHPKIKTISAQFEKTAADPRFRFFGNIAVGQHVQADELAERYDAVIYAVGAQSDRPLNIPGEDLTGSVAAVDFVGWYNAHPHFEEMTPDLSTGRAIVVGNGNVALDVARILVSDPDLLAATDIADARPGPAARPRRRGGRGHRPPRPAAGHLHHAGAARAGRPRGDGRRRRDRRPRRLRRHHRRGPRGGRPRASSRTSRCSAGTPSRSREAPSAASCSGSAPRRSRSRATAGSNRSCSAATSWSTTTAAWSPRTPASARSCPRSWWFAPSGTAACRRRDCRSTNARARFRTPTAGSTAARNEYVVGWIKRGPSGVIGSNKKDSQETVNTLVADLAARSVADFGDRAFRGTRRMAAVAPTEAGHR